MEITYCESEYPAQVNIKVDAETGELVKMLRARKIKLGPLLRPVVVEQIKAVIKEIEEKEAS